MNPKTLRILFLVLAVFILVTSHVHGQNTQGPIPVYVTPVYNYNPLTIKVGEYSKELSTPDPQTLLATANKIRQDINNVKIEALYVLATRLYDLGKKDEAFYWYMIAQSRGRIFTNMLDKDYVGGIGAPAFETEHLFMSFDDLIGEYIKGHGLNDVDKGLAIIAQAKYDIKFVQSFRELYPNIRFIDDSKLEREKSREEADLQQAIDYLSKNKEEFKKKRIEAGVQDKY